MTAGSVIPHDRLGCPSLGEVIVSHRTEKVGTAFSAVPGQPPRHVNETTATIVGPNMIVKDRESPFPAFFRADFTDRFYPDEYNPGWPVSELGFCLISGMCGRAGESPGPGRADVHRRKFG